MIDFGLLGEQFSMIFTPARLLLLVGFSFLGLLCGAMPGISSTMTISLLISLTYGMTPFNGLLVLIAAYTASTFGGSLSATLLNVPGTPAAAATALEAYPMAQRGEAGRAIGIATVQSFTGGILGTLILLFSAPLVAEFGPWEYFWFSIFGIFICANLSGESTIKGLIAGIFGILFSLVGVDPLHGVLRYTFGIHQLEGGISYIPALIGLYGVAEALSEFIKTTEGIVIQPKSGVLPPLKEYLRGLWLSVKVTFLGFLIGALPGTGANIAAWVGYDHAKRVSKHPERFGKGNPEGIVGAETANNACCAGVYLPLLTLAIPGDATTAIVLGMMLVTTADMVWFVWILLFTETVMWALFEPGRTALIPSLCPRTSEKIETLTPCCAVYSSLSLMLPRRSMASGSRLICSTQRPTPSLTDAMSRLRPSRTSAITLCTRWVSSPKCRSATSSR